MKNITAIAAGIVGLVSFLLMLRADHWLEFTALAVAGLIGFATAGVVAMHEGGDLAWPAPIFAWGMIAVAVSLAAACFAVQWWIPFSVGMLALLATAVAAVFVEGRSAATCAMSLVFAVSVAFAALPFLTTFTVNEVSLGSVEGKIVNAASIEQMPAEQAGNTPTGCDKTRFDAYAAPEGSNNFGPTQMNNGLKAVVARFHDKFNDCLYLAGTREYLVNGMDFDPKVAEANARVLMNDPAKAKETIDWINDHVETFILADAGHQQYATIGMIPGKNPGDVPTFTQFTELPELGKTLVVVLKDKGANGKPIVRTFREICDIQFAAPMFTQVKGTTPQKPAVTKVPPTGGGNPSTHTTTTVITTTKTTPPTGGSTPSSSTPSSTPSSSTPSSTPSSSTPSSTPSSSTPSSSTPSSSTPSSSTTKPKDTDTTSYKEDPEASDASVTEPATTPNVPDIPAGTTTPGAVVPDAGAPSASATEEPTGPVGTPTQAPPASSPGTGDVDPDGAGAPAGGGVPDAGAPAPAPAADQPTPAPAPAGAPDASGGDPAGGSGSGDAGGSGGSDGSSSPGGSDSGGSGSDSGDAGGSPADAGTPGGAPAGDSPELMSSSKTLLSTGQAVGLIAIAFLVIGLLVISGIRQKKA